MEIAVWKNHGQNGDFFTASAPTIRYKDDKTGDFKDGSNYGAIDLLALSEAARETSRRYGAAFARIVWVNGQPFAQWFEPDNLSDPCYKHLLEHTGLLVG